VARIRSIKPEFWSDRSMSRLTRDCRMLYMALWNVADEHGRCNGDPRLIKGQAFPYDDDITAAVVEGMLADLAAAGRVDRYDVDDDPYLFLPKLAKHQRLEADKVESRLPPPPDPDRVAPPRGQVLHPDANESSPDSDESARGADKNALLYVAGSREHVAGSGELPPSPAAPKTDKTGTRGTRLPDNWELPDDWRLWAVAEGATEQQALAWSMRFADYWRGRAGAGGRKADWLATWRNWVRSELEKVKPVEAQSYTAWR
jgi:hypothetical protein